MDRSRTAAIKKSEWTASKDSFAALLEWLDQGLSTNGESYLKVRQRLVTYFDRKGCSNADDLADETLTRVQRRLEEEGSIDTESPAKFCYTIARYVFLEHLRSGRSKEVGEEHAERAAVKSVSEEFAESEAAREKERVLGCLEKCLQELDAERRELVLGYYVGEQRTKIENRRSLAEKLGLSMNALSIRTFRIRERLELCVTKCTAATK